MCAQCAKRQNAHSASASFADWPAFPPLPHVRAGACAGFVSAALCSVLVGSVHYASFCWSKRLALQAMGPAGSPNSSSSSSNDSSQFANMLAASIGALATALVESPVELFRHQAQAGNVSGNVLQEMVTSVRKNVSRQHVSVNISLATARTTGVSVQLAAVSAGYGHMQSPRAICMA
jgi:hypothetical protein